MGEANQAALKTWYEGDNRSVELRREVEQVAASALRFLMTYDLTDRRCVDVSDSALIHDLQLEINRLRDILTKTSKEA